MRVAAKSALKYPPVRFTGRQALAISRGFAMYVRNSGIVMWACAIMPDHVHFVIARHMYPIERIVLLLKSAATVQLIKEGLHPFGDKAYADGRIPHCWGQGEWKVFLNDDAQIRAGIAYVEQNPEKAGYRRQNWRFVTPYTGLVVP